MAVVIRNEDRHEMPGPFTARGVIQIQQASAETVLLFLCSGGEKRVLLRAFKPRYWIPLDLNVEKKKKHECLQHDTAIFNFSPSLSLPPSRL